MLRKEIEWLDSISRNMLMSKRKNIEHINTLIDQIQKLIELTQSLAKQHDLEYLLTSKIFEKNSDKDDDWESSGCEWESSGC